MGLTCEGAIDRQDLAVILITGHGDVAMAVTPAARRLRLRGEALPARTVGRNGDASGGKSPPASSRSGAAGPARRSMRHRVVNSRQFARQSGACTTVRSRSGRPTRERPHSGETGTGKSSLPAVCISTARAAQSRSSPSIAVAYQNSCSERDVRLRGRRIHRGCAPPHGKIQRHQRRHAVSRRDRKHAAGLQVKLLRVLQEQKVERLGIE